MGGNRYLLAGWPMATFDLNFVQTGEAFGIEGRKIIFPFGDEMLVPATKNSADTGQILDNILIYVAGQNESDFREGSDRLKGMKMICIGRIVLVTVSTCV